MEKKVIGTFHSEAEVIRKIDELKEQGYSGSDIYAVAKDEDNISMLRGRTDVDIQTADGNWFDRMMSFLTGDEPVREAMYKMGLSDEEADRYYREIDNGSILLYVDSDYDQHFDSDIKVAYPTDVNLGPDPIHDPNVMDRTERLDGEMVNGQMADDLDVTDEQRMRLHEEKLRIDKDRVQTGEVRVEKNVVEEEQSVDVPVSREEVYIERRPVEESYELDDDNAFINDGETIRVPLSEERLDVQKKPVVNEEIVIGKKEVEDTETVRETVRREEADIDRNDHNYRTTAEYTNGENFMNDYGQNQEVTDELTSEKEGMTFQERMKNRMKNERDFFEPRDDNFEDRSDRL